MGIERINNSDILDETMALMYLENPEMFADLIDVIDANPDKFPGAETQKMAKEIAGVDFDEEGEIAAVLNNEKYSGQVLHTLTGSDIEQEGLYQEVEQSMTA